jgi:hypothetical protein
MTTHIPYAVFSYANSVNLGDEIQSIASIKLLKHFGIDVNCYIDRDLHTRKWKCKDRLELVGNSYNNTLNTTKKIKLLHNGWLDGSYMTWHSEADVDPLLISVHINETIKDQSYKWLDEHKIKFKSLVDAGYAEILHTDIGARDIHTYTKLIRSGFPTNVYLSGCITMTLGVTRRKRNERNERKRNGIYLSDVSKNSLRKYVPDDLLLRAQSITHVYQHDLKAPGVTAVKFAMAKQLLKIYKNAQLVITSRLHCALPCLAYGTPVLYYHQNAAPTDVRYQGLIDTIPVIGRDLIDYDNVVNVLPPDFDSKVNIIMQKVLAWTRD